MLDYVDLYQKYDAELKDLRENWISFCSQKVPDGWPHKYYCSTSILETELLYLRIRYLKPRHILEVSSATGFSTLGSLNCDYFCHFSSEKLRFHFIFFDLFL